MIAQTIPDLYEEHNGEMSCEITHVQIVGDFIYFSYGEFAGSGHFFQGGNIIKGALMGVKVNSL